METDRNNSDHCQAHPSWKPHLPLPLQVTSFALNNYALPLATHSNSLPYSRWILEFCNTLKMSVKRGNTWEVSIQINTFGKGRRK